jgi:hypothetical protein
MHYIQYHKEIIMRYSVALEGWTHPNFANPSDLSTSIPPLQELLDAIDSGQCKFVKLTSEQQKAEDDKYREKIKNGQITATVRATRKDKGKKRKAREVAGDDSDDNESGESDNARSQGPSTKRRRCSGKKAAQKSAEHVASDVDD